MKKILLFLAVFAAFIPAVNAQKVKETHMYAIKGTDTLFVDRHIDLSKVKGELVPTMVYMYGGGWAFGARGGDFSYLTDIGVQVVSIDYRKGLTKYGYNPAPLSVAGSSFSIAGSLFLEQEHSKAAAAMHDTMCRNFIV